MQTIALHTNFFLVIKVKKSDVVKIQKLLDENKFKYEGWEPTIFDGFVEYRIVCNLRKAELVRQLLKNFVIYE